MFPSVFQVWFVLSGARAKKQAAGEGAYAKYTASTDAVPDEIVYRVEADAKAACQAHSAHRVFCTAKGMETLSRLLLAYAAAHPSGGYSKGLNHIAALTLLVFGREREEDAFWTLCALMEDRLLPGSGGQVRWQGRVSFSSTR